LKAQFVNKNNKAILITAENEKEGENLLFWNNSILTAEFAGFTDKENA
jgi:hypothetical protein